MLVCVAFGYVAGCVCVSVDVALETLTCATLTSSAGREISREEGSSSLMSSSTNVVGAFWLKLCGHHCQCVWRHRRIVLLGLLVRDLTFLGCLCARG